MTTAHSSTTSATTHDLGSRRAAGRSGRLVRLTASVTAVVVIGTAAGIAVDRATATGTGTGPTIAVPDTSVGVVFSAAAQTAGVRAADDATTKAYRDPLGAVLFGTSWAAPSVAPDPLAALLFGTHWPLVATFGADQPQVDLTDQTSH